MRTALLRTLWQQASRHPILRRIRLHSGSQRRLALRWLGGGAEPPAHPWNQRRLVRPFHRAARLMPVRLPLRAFRSALLRIPFCRGMVSGILPGQAARQAHCRLRQACRKCLAVVRLLPLQRASASLLSSAPWQNRRIHCPSPQQSRRMGCPLLLSAFRGRRNSFRCPVPWSVRPKPEWPESLFRRKRGFPVSVCARRQAASSDAVSF